MNGSSIGGDGSVAVKENRTLSGPALVLAIVMLALWAVMAAILVFRAGDSTEVTWARYAYIFASVEAVAFAAGGALWGNSIQRERAEKAEKAAAENAQDSSNGRALAASLMADSDETAAAGRPGVQGFGAGGDAVAERHAKMAKALFPDV